MSLEHHGTLEIVIQEGSIPSVEMQAPTNHAMCPKSCIGSGFDSLEQILLCWNPPPGELGNNTFGYVGEMIGLCILGETIGYIM